MMINFCTYLYDVTSIAYFIICCVCRQNRLVMQFMLMKSFNKHTYERIPTILLTKDLDGHMLVSCLVNYILDINYLYFNTKTSYFEQEDFQSRFSAALSKIGYVGVSQCTPLDPVEEERLRNKCWLEVAGGRYKGRVYGVGHVDSRDDRVQSYLKQTQACSSQQVPSKEINEL